MLLCFVQFLIDKWHSVCGILCKGIMMKDTINHIYVHIFHFIDVIDPTPYAMVNQTKGPDCIVVCFINVVRPRKIIS